jgi:hypothetical protein
VPARAPQLSRKALVMLLTSLIVLVMACVVLAAFRAHSLHQSAVRVRVDRDWHRRSR